MAQKDIAPLRTAHRFVHLWQPIQTAQIPSIQSEQLTSMRPLAKDAMAQHAQNALTRTTQTTSGTIANNAL